MDDCRSLPPVCHRYQRAAELLGRRWSAAVIRATMEGPARFTEIRGSVDGLSARLLAERLRELEGAGLMERRELPAAAPSSTGSPPRARPSRASSTRSRRGSPPGTPRRSPRSREEAPA